MNAFQRRFTVAVVCAAVLVAGSGCGNRLSHDEIQAAGAPSSAGGVAGPSVTGSTAIADLSGSESVPGQVTSGAQTGASAVDGLGPAPGAAASDRGGVPQANGSAGAAKVPTGTANTPVTIGNIGTYSGVIGAVIGGMPKALQAWALSINARGGLAGHPVKVVTADDGADPSRDISLAQRMIDKDKIIAFVCNYLFFGNAAPSIDKMAADAHIPNLAPDATNPTNYTSTNTFPVAPYFATAINVLMKELATRGATKLGMLYCVEAVKLCGGVADAVKKSNTAGVQFVYDAPASITAPSFTAQCLSMKNAGANGAVLLMDGASDARILRDCQVVDTGLKTVQVAGFTLAAPDLTNPTMQGAIVATSLVPGDQTQIAAVAAYQAAMRQYAPGVVLNINTLQAWTAGALLEVAAKRLAQEFRWQDLYTGLRTIKNSTLGGLTVPLTFADGSPPVVGKCAWMQVIDGGKLTSPHGSKQFCL